MHRRWLLKINLALRVCAAVGWTVPSLALGQTQCEPITVQIDSMVDFDRDIRPIFDSKCISCHSGLRPEAGLDLAGPSGHGAVVGQISSLDSRFELVRPFEPAESLLWQMVHCSQPPVGRAMPVGMPQLSLAERRKIFSWISRGAAAGIDGSTRSIPITPSLSGTWYDPSASGQGFAIEIVDSPTKQVILFWLTFAQAPIVEGGARLLDLEKRWFVGVGSHEAFRADISLLASEGGLFDNSGPIGRTTALGQATLQFHSCNNASLHYLIASEGGDSAPAVSRGVALRRLTPSATCPETMPP